MDNELELLEQNLDELQSRLESRRRLRELNSSDRVEFPSEEALEGLDSSIKKNSAFVKRLKVFSESQKDLLLNDIDRLNLTKFISEVASSIVEAKFKLSDIPAVIEICTKLNCKYREFSKHLLDQYVKSFPIIKKKTNDTSSPTANLHSGTPLLAQSSNGFSSTGNLVLRFSSNKSEAPSINHSKIRVDLRVFAELLLVGIFELKDGFPILLNLLYYLMVYDKNNHQHANAILAFCKGCGDEFLGLAQRKLHALSMKHKRNLPNCDIISVKKQDALRTHIVDYYKNLVKRLFDLYDEIRDLAVSNRKAYGSKGEVCKESKELIELKQSEIQKFTALLIQFAEVLGEEQPEIPSLDLLAAEIKDECNDVDISNELGSSRQIGSQAIWDDEGTRSFYQDTLDLSTIFPNLKLKATNCRKKLTVQNKSSADINLDVQGNKSSKSVEDDSRETTPTKERDDNSDESARPLSSSSSEDSLVGETTNSPTLAPVMTISVGNRTQPEQYFAKLSNCVNRDMIDEAAIDFIRFFNTKFGRKKLVKTLFNVQRTRLDLLPFLARLTATLYPFVPSVGSELASLLKQDFRTLFKKKDQINIESKVKNVRFIGELIKFNLIPENEALNCLVMLLSDFTHHHIEMTCNLLETCGRMLFNSVDSHHKLRQLLEQMMRKKLLLSIDSKYVTMIENAYYYTNPPEIVKHVVEEPPVHVYVRYLLCDCLDRSTIDIVLQKLKKLDWTDKNLAKFVITCMIEAYNLKFYNIRYLAALLAALNKEHPWISVAVIDGVVEDIILMMEVSEIHFNQRRIPMIRYFGELYNYKLSDSSLVFKILYLLITYGVHYPEPDQTLARIPLSHLDPPDNLFRVKLICGLLETCGQYLSNGQEKKKLDCYLSFFQRYYWCKKYIFNIHPFCMAKSGNQFPASIEYLYNDAIINLRPDFQMVSSYAQACNEVKNFVERLNRDQSPS